MSRNSITTYDKVRWPGMLGGIRAKLTISFGLLFVAVLTVVELVGFVGLPVFSLPGRQSRERQEAFNSLSLIADLKEERLHNWLEERRDDIHLAAETEFVSASVGQLQSLIRELAADGRRGGELWAEVKQAVAYEYVARHLDHIRTTYGVYDEIAIADVETGTIILSTDESALGADVSLEPFFVGALESHPDFVGEVMLDPRSERPVLTISHLLHGEAGETIAVLVIQVNVDDVIGPMLHTGGGLGERGEVVLVNQGGVIVASLKHALPDGAIARPLEYQIQALPAKLAAAGAEGMIQSEDYRGEPVLAAFRHIPVSPDWGWGMVVKRDEAELFAPLREDMIQSFRIGLAGILAVVGLTIVMSRTLTRPMRSLGRAAMRVVDGDLTTRAPVRTGDEVGVLAQVFNTMVERVQRSHEDLEAQVQVRTEELTATNRELAEEIIERARADEALREYSERLQEMVGERTKELKDAQAQLVRQERLAMLGQLAGGIGHELRNPLGVISNAVYFLQMTVPNPDETTREYLEIITQEVQNSEKIVSDLLEFARTRPSAAEEVRVWELLAHVLDRHPPPENVATTCDAPPGLPLVFIDPRQIEQVLGSLVQNAYQAMPDGGRLDLRAVAEGDEVTISVADTGVGISTENLPKLFEPLFTTKARGIGLGLAISKKYVEANGGRIEAESREDTGVTFTVRLPLDRATGDDPDDPAAATDNRGETL